LTVRRRSFKRPAAPDQRRQARQIAENTGGGTRRLCCDRQQASDHDRNDERRRRETIPRGSSKVAHDASGAERPHFVNTVREDFSNARRTSQTELPVFGDFV
jgi:hypothetical protein